MLTLYAEQRKEITGIYKGLVKTILKNPKGVIRAVIPPNQKQPSKNESVIIINCFYYQLIFSKNKNIN